MLHFTNTFYFTLPICFKGRIQLEEKKQHGERSRDSREQPGRGGRGGKQMSRRINYRGEKRRGWRAS